MPMPSGNVFAALPAADPEGTLRKLTRDAPPALRWFHPSDLHLTLSFFGRLAPERLPDVQDVLRQISFEGAEVTLGALIPLPRPARFTALSFEIRQGRDELSALIATWRPCLLEAAGCPPDHRPPLPHLTIARPHRKDPHFHPRAILQWCHSVHPAPTPIVLQPPVLYGWAPGYAEANQTGAPRFQRLPPNEKPRPGQDTPQTGT